MDNEKDVQGVAVYAEFRKGTSGTAQIIVIPDGYDNAGKLHGLTIARRVVSQDSPKKPWRFTTLDAVAEGDVIADDDREEFAERRMAIPSTLLDQYLNGGWALVGDPLLIESSKKDMDSIAVGKTPTKMIYRITQSRTAAGYPADLIPS
jgi:hypothetical protein